jgi:O-antigen/teichoic acid export membrane protein
MSLSPVKRNIAANVLGKGWAVLLSLALIPVYLRFLGAEAYGLVGFYLSLFALASVFDLGLGTTLTRELARLATDAGEGQRMRNLLRTLEWLSFGVAAGLGILTVALAPLIARHWIQAGSLGTETVEHAVMLMGLALAVQWPMSLYSGGLIGLQHQVLFNTLSAAFTAFRGIGAAIVLWLIAPRIEVFFAWQAVASVLQTGVTAFALWRCMPRTDGAPRFQLAALGTVGGFAVGVSAIVLLGVVVSQLDKLLLSKLLSLETFGYYTLAGVVASAATLLVSPLFTATLPRFTELIAQGDTAATASLYHRTSQAIAVVTCPLAATVALFAWDIVHLWTGQREIADATAPVVQALAVGAALNGLLNAPYALQLAYGWTRLGVILGLVNLVLAVPLLYFAATHYGAVGAAWAMAALSAFNVVVGLGLLHARYLRGEAFAWYFRDTLPIAGVALLVVFTAYAVIPEHASTFATLLAVGATLICAFAACVFSATETRHFALDAAQRLLGRHA